MLKLFALTLALASVLIAPPAEAQSFFLQDSALFSEGVNVGHAVQAPVQITAAREDEVTMTYRGTRVRVEATLPLASSHLQVGVGREVTLAETAFQTEMLAATWAPVMRMNDTRIVVALPPGSPQADASLTRDPRLTRGAGRPRTGPWDHHGDLPRDDQAAHCVDFALSPTPATDPSFHPPNTAARHRLRTEGDFDVFAVTIEGFVFTGFRARDLPCVQDELELGLIGGGFSCGDGAATHRVVILDARTELFVTPASTHAFATLLARGYGIEIEPGNPSRFLVQVEDGRATFQLRIFVRTPNEALRDAPRGHRGFGLTRAPMDDWPTR